MMAQTVDFLDSLAVMGSDMLFARNDGLFDPPIMPQSVLKLDTHSL